MPSRRRFLQLAGAGAAASLTAGKVRAADQSTHPAATPRKRNWDLGLAAYTLHQFARDQVWPMAKRVGLKHVCMHPSLLPIASTSEQIAQTAATAKAAGIDLYACGVIGMYKPEDVERAFEYAKTLGIRMIIGMPLVELLPLVNQKVQQYDIRLAIHNHGPGDKNYPLPGTAYEKIKNLDRRVGLCMDIGHTMRAGVDPSQAAEQFADRLFDLHLKDVSAAVAKGTCVEAGRGVIDLPKLVRTLDKIGYSGMGSFEFEKDENDPLPGLAESVGYFRGLMAVVELPGNVG